MIKPLYKTAFAGLPEAKYGKVRDIYDLGEHLLIVACDRISAYDHNLQPAIPGKGKILNQLTNFWFEQLKEVVPHHLVAVEPEDFPAFLKPFAEDLRGRAVLVRKTEVVPFECVARGYLAGSAFREYAKTGATCGIELPPGLKRADRLPTTLFTPATKAEEGHDENVSFSFMADSIGEDLARSMQKVTVELYETGATHALDRGLILADTKFEFGLLNDELILIDEVLTPDSSRYWDLEIWTPGEEPASFDKQFVRNWLDEIGWDHESTPPELTPEVVQGTMDRYVEAFRKITDQEPIL